MSWPTQEPAPPPAPYPVRVGRYEILLPIASGGMATVFLGRILAGFDFEREVAIKLVHAHLRGDGFDRELVEEAKLSGRIRHPNVVQTLDVGEDAGGVFLVMDYVEGDSLSGLMRALRGGPSIAPGVALRVLVDALRGLHVAHELRDAAGTSAEVVHRDFSPQNVLVGTDGIAKLADFGIAKAATRLAHTATGIIKGKFGYIAPEQALAKRLDRRVDVWAAGVIAWEISLKRRLRPAGNDASTLLKIVGEDAPRLRSVEPRIPVALEEAVAAALARDPKRRTPTAEALADAIERACAGSEWELADHRETREAVLRVAGPRIAERRAAAEEIRRLRRSMGRVAARAPVEKAASPFSVVPPADPATRESLERTSDRPVVLDRPTLVAPRGVAGVTVKSGPRPHRPLTSAIAVAMAALVGLAGIAASFAFGDPARASSATPPKGAVPSAHARSSGAVSAGDVIATDGQVTSSVTNATSTSSEAPVEDTRRGAFDTVVRSKGSRRATTPPRLPAPSTEPSVPSELLPWRPQ